MTEDRKRLLISIFAAAVLHFGVLLLTGMYSFDYEVSSEYGPITVEIDLNRPQTETPPEPDPVPAEEFTEDESVTASEEPESPAAEPRTEPEPAPEPVPAPQPDKPAVQKPVNLPRPRTEEPAVDEDFLQAIRDRRSSVSSVDAVQAFGDDKAAPTTNRTDTWAAKGSADGSEVVLSDVPAPVQSSNAVQDADDSTPATFIDENLFRRLDSGLDAGYSAQNTENDSPSDAGSPSVAEPAAGNIPFVVFENPSASRKLERWYDPEIPEDVQKLGISEYRVIIEFEIQPSGIVSLNPKVHTSGNTQIDTAVKKSLLQWKFAEAPASAKNVRAILTYIIKID